MTLSDIVPFSFKVADELKIFAIDISNLKWYTAYKQLISSPTHEPLKEYYALMDYYLSLAASNEITMGKLKKKIRFSFLEM